MLWWHYVIVTAAGFMAGLINAIAGSGSLLTLPVLMLVGVPATVANGTNRLAMLSQAVTAVLSYRQKGVRDFGHAYWLIVPPCVGAVLGASLALQMPDALLSWILLVVMLIMCTLLFVKPKQWNAPLGEVPQDFSRKPIVWIIFFLIGVYAGFVQVGSNYLVLTILVLWGRFDVHHGNTLKSLIQAGFTLMALPIFILGGKVNWLVGLPLALGAAAGAIVGARLALRLGTRFVRILLVSTLILFTTKQAVDFYLKYRGVAS